MRPPITSLVIQTWKDQGRPKPWKQYGRRSSSPDSLDSDAAPSEDDRLEHPTLRSFDEHFQIDASLDSAGVRLRGTASVLEETRSKEPENDLGAVWRRKLNETHHSSSLLRRSQSLDSGLRLRNYSHYRKAHDHWHESRKYTLSGRSSHEKNCWHHFGSHIHHNRVDGFAHPPPYPKRHVWHRPSSVGGDTVSYLAKGIPRSTSHSDRLIYADRLWHSIPRSRSMDSDLLYSSTAARVDHAQIEKSTPHPLAGSSQALPNHTIVQKFGVGRSQSMDDGLAAALRGNYQCVIVYKDLSRRRHRQVLENIEEHAPSINVEGHEQKPPLLDNETSSTDGGLSIETKEHGGVSQSTHVL